MSQTTLTLAEQRDLWEWSRFLHVVARGFALWLFVVGLAETAIIAHARPAAGLVAWGAAAVLASFWLTLRMADHVDRIDGRLRGVRLQLQVEDMLDRQFDSVVKRQMRIRQRPNDQRRTA